MKLGFYYHIPYTVRNEKYFIPSLLGTFLNEIASQVSYLILFLHEANDTQDIENAGMEINSDNITVISLGLKTKAWHRSLFHKTILSNIKPVLKNLDALLIRSPSPLASHFYHYIDHGKIIFFVVGDYKQGAIFIKNNSLRNIAIKFYLKLIDYKFKKQIANSFVIVNSYQLYNDLLPINSKIKTIITSTLSHSDFYTKPLKLNQRDYNILYTGRIDPSKGLFELLQSMINLSQKGYNIKLNIAGYETGDKSTTKQLTKIAHKSNFSDRLIFHGMKQAGEELNQVYRMADIYVIPSYHEGFPRTIWEAMANSCPVIATEVGGIPFFLKHLEHAILIKPKSSEAIVEAVETLINDGDLRARLIENGQKLARQAIQEKQVRLLINYIHEFINESQ